MENLKLAESDFRFMGVIWDHEPVTSKELVQLCQQHFGWKKSTTYTMIKKLCEKGFAQSVDAVVTALIPRDRVQAYESERFVEHAFQGSLPGFLAAFLGGKTLSLQEAEKLKQLIDQHREN